MNDGNLDNIKDLFDGLQENVYQIITTTWAALGFVVAAAGVSLYFLARIWTESAVKNRLDTMEKSLKESLRKEIKETHKVFTIRISAGSTVRLPYEQKGAEHPKVFVRAHRSDAVYELKIDDGFIQIENKNISDLPIDIMVINQGTTLL